MLAVDYDLQINGNPYTEIQANFLIQKVSVINGSDTTHKKNQHLPLMQIIGKKTSMISQVIRVSRKA